MSKVLPGTALVAVVMFLAWPAVSLSASPQACFGQGRAEYAVNGPESPGYWASQRKGTNSTMNQDYMAACQPS